MIYVFLLMVLGYFLCHSCFLFVTGFNAMHNWTALTIYGVTRKRGKQDEENIGSFVSRESK